MFRAVVALALLVTAVVVALDGREQLEPRGATLRVWNNPQWDGAPVRQATVRHLDFGEDFAPNRFTLAPQTSARLEGWLYAPRGGAYDFAVSSQSATWLRIDGKTVLAHRRDRSETRVTTRLAKGYHLLRIDVQHRSGESRLQVKWRLPSGYMKLTALPPVFVRPATIDAAGEAEPPTRGPLPLAQRVAPALLVGLALVVLFAPWVARRLTKLRDAGSRRRFGLGILVFAGALGVRLVDLNGAGETSDEWAYSGAGRIYVSNIAHGYWESAYWHTNEEHPPIGKYLYGLVSHLSGTDSYSPLRATAAGLGALTVLLVWRLGVRYMGGRAALFAAVVLALLPAFVAHGKVAALDAPSAFLATLSAFLFIRSFDFAGRLDQAAARNGYLLGAAFVASLAFSTKFSNVLVFFFMVFVIIADQWDRIRRRGIIEVPLAVYALPILPFVVLVAFWPWLWVDPFAQLVKTLTHWDYPVSEWFLGDYRRPPLYYYFVYLVATTPALLLAPFAVFLYFTFRRRDRFHVIVLIWFATPFLWSVSSLKQDGVRYVYNVFPAFALAIGAGLDALLAWRPPARPRIAGAVVAAGVAAYTGWQSWLVHPYYLNYYNELFGGTRGVFMASRFEVGWWGEGLDRAISWMNTNAPKGATWDCQGVVTHTFDGLRKDLVNRPSDPEYVVQSYLTPSELERQNYEPVFRVDAAGAPIVVIWKRLSGPPTIDTAPRPGEGPDTSGRRPAELPKRNPIDDTAAPE